MRSTLPPPHGMSTGDPPRSVFRPPTRLGHPLGRPESPLRAKIKSGNQKKIDFPHPTSYMYEPRGYVYEVGFFAHYSNQRRPTAMAPAQWHGGALSPLCAPMAPLWQRWQPIFRPLGSQYHARTPRRLCALSRPCAPSGAERTGRNRHLRTSHVPNLAFSGNGDEKK